MSSTVVKTVFKVLISFIDAILFMRAMSMRKLVLVLVNAMTFTTALINSVYIVLISFVNTFLVTRFAMSKLMFVLVIAMSKALSIWLPCWWLSWCWSITFFNALTESIISFEHAISITIACNQIFHMLLITNIVTFLVFLSKGNC